MISKGTVDPRELDDHPLDTPLSKKQGDFDRTRCIKLNTDYILNSIGE